MSNSKKWIIVALYTVIILATIPLARAVWDFIGVSWGYVILFGLYCGIIGYIYFRFRNILILGLVILISLAIFKIIPQSVERIHFIEYGLLGWMLWWAAGPKKWSFVIVLTYIIAISVLDEVIQGILPSRVYDIRDIWMNVAGGFIGLVLRIYAR